MMVPEVAKHYGRLKNYINGEWVEPATGQYFTTTNPATDEVIAEAPIASRADVEAAIGAAYEAFKKWRDVPFRDRAKKVFTLREKCAEKSEWLARILVQDHGCTIEEGRGTCARIVENVEAAGSSMYGPYRGEHVDQLATGIDCYQIREPAGVFLIITPGNIPTHAWSSFVPYAIACGCTVIVKPSRQDPVAADSVMKVTEEVGLPPGVVNLVHMGPERELNKVILSDPRIKGVGLIGSTRVSKELFELAGRYGKRTSLNGNGKNHIVVMPDAPLDNAANYLLRGCFGMSGQRCLGSDNVIIIGDDGRYRELREAFLAASKAMKMGYGLDESVELGPLTTKQGKEKVERFIEDGLKAGARAHPRRPQGARQRVRERLFYRAEHIRQRDARHGPPGEGRGIRSACQPDAGERPGRGDRLDKRDQLRPLGVHRNGERQGGAQVHPGVRGGKRGRQRGHTAAVLVLRPWLEKGLLLRHVEVADGLDQALPR